MVTVPDRRLGVGLLQHADSLPDHVALSLDGREYSYHEVAETARRWAAAIVEAAGPRPRRVGVLAARSPAAYLGVAAALFAGAAFVPLSRHLPLRRTRTMLERSAPDALIVDAASLPQLPQLLDGLPRRPAVLLPDSAPTSLVGGLGDGPVLHAADLAGVTGLEQLPEPEPGEAAYVLFTSGSTGEPKAVPITHANIRSFLTVNQDRYRITPRDRLTQIGEQTFDLSVFDLFMAWENGARVCVMDPQELSWPFDYLERQQITVWFSVPSVAAALRRRGLLTPGSMPTLRWSLFCGEALPQATAEAWQAAAPASVVENLYGPTELTIACTAYRWDPYTSPAQCVHDNVPIGRPYPGLHTLIVDEDLTPVADGATGELCVAGPQTTPGYWQAPRLNAERFFERDGHRYYRTGDLVRTHHDQLICIGRNDHQVKIDGYRIELGEIEAVLRRAGAVEAVCLMWPDAATITAVLSGAADPAAVSEASARSLPSYMLPASVHTIETMPLNPHGKVDRTALRCWLDDRAKTPDPAPDPAPDPDPDPDPDLDLDLDPGAGPFPSHF
ncbi:amino acid adenylation domain-containing protein [Streptomyces sp. NPDC059008]|uniref:amino acid adenylation domain-containing protein n=1 Tax=Streptomyces sp. NPDC059008 TaxID=3346693 RepID=UPI00369EE856